MWLKYRNLYEIIVKYANSNGTDETSKDIVDVLTKNRSVLLSVLKNLGRSSSHRAQLDNIGGSVKLESGQSVKVDQALRSESIIISDLFNCDELDALELVLSGELQLQNFGFLTRGLCAIICYYDAHRFLSASVKALIEMKISEDIQKSKELDAFLEQFCSDPQLPRRLIEVLRTVNTQTEFQNLHQPQVNGLGGPKHQRMLREMIDETLSNCTSALFSLCSSWRKDFVPPFMRDLFAPLKAIQPSVVFQNSHLSLWTALLILISPHNIQHLRCAKEILEAFCKEVFSSEWSDQCVAASLQLACVVTFNWLNVHQAVHEVLGDFSLSEDEFLERAIGSLCFVFIRKCIITSPGFRSNVVFFDVVDALLKNFIAHFPSKLVLLQRVCEEELLYTEELLAKGELYWPKCHFEAFLHCIGDLYDDESERTILLSSQFTSVTSEELVKFIKNGRNLYAPVLHVAFLDMAKNLCKTRDNAEFFYQLVSSFPSVKGSDERTLNIHHFWKALREYLLLFQRRRTSVSNVLRPFTAHPDSSHLQINQSELAGLIAWVQFCERIAIHDPNARLHFVENSLWACTETVVGLLVCSVPLVLKGSLYRFLAAVAKDEQSAVHIWSSLSANGVLSQSPNGKLTGIQEELDDRECSLKRYDSSLGFLALMKELLLHLSSSSDALHLQLYLQFISKSIICQFGNRSYENVQQMWQLCSTACDALYNFLSQYTVTVTSLINGHAQVFVLTQLLNDSPVFRALVQVLFEAAERLSDFSTRCPFREAAALSVLRLIDASVARHTAFSDAIRSSDSSLLVASLDALLLSSVPTRTKTCVITVIASYIIHVDLLPYHAVRAVSILRELCAARPSLQARIVCALTPLLSELVDGCTRITSTRMTEICVTPLDSAVSTHAMESLPLERVRGETARLLIETCSSAIDSDPSAPNIAFLLCNFDLSDLANSRLENPGVNGVVRAYLHNAVQILSDLADHENPFDLTYSGLFEPTMRLILRFVAVDAISAQAVLRYIRSNHDLVYRLAASDLMSHPLQRCNEEERIVVENLTNMLQGYILHLTAVELSELLRMHRYSQPERYYRLMFGSKDYSADSEVREVSDRASSVNVTYPITHADGEKADHLLWRVLNNTRTNDDVLRSPSLELLNVKKLRKIIALCIRPTSSNAEQCDIEHLSWLLKREARSVASDVRSDYLECASREMQQILQYCTTYNLLKMGEASARQLLSGWLSLVNVLAVFAPVPFVSPDSQINILMDAVYLLTRFAPSLELDAQLSSAISQCLLRLINSICCMLKGTEVNVGERRIRLAPFIDVCVRFLTHSGVRYMQSKLDLYACILSVLNSSAYPLEEESKESDKDIRATDNYLFGLSSMKVKGSDPIKVALFERGSELVTSLSNDICEAPQSVKILALSCLTEVLKEDLPGSRSLTLSFVRSGILRYIIDSLTRIDTTVKTEAVNDAQELLYFKIVTVLFIRLALTECGWNALRDVRVLPSLARLKLWKHPPKEVFSSVKKESRSSGTPQLYIECLDVAVRLCLALCSNPQWKCISQEVIYFLSRNTEVFGHLMRSDPNTSVLKCSSALVSHIYSLDETTRSFIDESVCLQELKKRDTPMTDERNKSASMLPSFNTPKRLFNVSTASTSEGTKQTLSSPASSRQIASNHFVSSSDSIFDGSGISGRLRLPLNISRRTFNSPTACAIRI